MPSDELTGIIKLIPEDLKPLARVQATEIRFMKRKLLQARRCIDDEEIVIPYNNGGGQSGIRANPAYAEYEKLYKTYDTAVRSLLDMLPDRKEERATASISKLESLTSGLKLVANR